MSDRGLMKMDNHVASIATSIREFSDEMTDGMKKNVRKHFREYLLGIMIPPEVRRKSISNISDLVSEYDQSTINRSIHAVDLDLMEKNYIHYLKSAIGNHRVQFIGDDTLLEHPGSKKMENVGWFFDHASGRNVKAHQPVTTMIHDLENDTFYPFLMRMYIKKEAAGDSFMTKLQIMQGLLEVAKSEFNVVGKTLDSWYSSKNMMDDNFVTELKANRKVSLEYMGKMTPRNRDLFLTLNEVLETTFVMSERDSDILKDFPLYCNIKAWLSNGMPVNMTILYNPETGVKKFLASDYAYGEDLIGEWNDRWPIESFHKDAKNLGLGEYQVRDCDGSLIHANITVAAYTLLSMMLKDSKRLFGKILMTIGQCSREIKRILISKRNYKSRVFSG